MRTNKISVNTVDIKNGNLNSGKHLLESCRN